MKYIILVHSHPQPWGHPTCDHLEEYTSLPDDTRAQMQAEFEQLWAEMEQRGELVTASPLGDPAGARVYRWAGGQPVATDGPYAETKDHLAGYFVIDVESEARAHEIATVFASPGDTIELRAIMSSGPGEP